MPGPTEHLKAYLIVDNCFLVMLTDCFCERFAARCGMNRIISEAEQWIDGILGIVKRLALDGNLHCSTGVVNEYNPHVGRMANLHGVQRNELNHLQGHLRATLRQAPMDLPAIQRLRLLPEAPRDLVSSTGLSDNDLSLVHLGLELTRKDAAVFILSNDQSLLDFITWVRTKKQQFQAPIVPDLLQGWRCLTYLELIHRSCNISTALMNELIEFALFDHYNRKDIAGRKGNSILQQLISVHGNFSQSVVIKQQIKAATQ